MGYFPLFIDLSGKEVLIAGGGAVAERKARILIRFGAAVRLVSPEATQGLLELFTSGRIEYISREYRSEDVSCAALVIAAAGSREINQSIYREAVQKGIPVNVVDDPELCTFFFPAVVCRNDLVIGITTSGSYPALSRYVREAVEELISEEYEVVTEHLREYREKVRAEIQDPIERRIVLRKLMETAVQTVEDNRQFCPRLLSERLNSTYEILRGIYIKPEHRGDGQ